MTKRQSCLILDCYWPGALALDCMALTVILHRKHTHTMAMQYFGITCADYDSAGSILGVTRYEVDSDNHMSNEVFQMRGTVIMAINNGVSYKTGYEKKRAVCAERRCRHGRCRRHYIPADRPKLDA